MKHVIFAAAYIISRGVVARGCGDTLWDNGDWDGAKALSSERDTEVRDSWVVDDFLVTEPVTVRELEWLALHSPGLDPDGADLILLSAAFDPIVELPDQEFIDEFQGTYMGVEVYTLTIRDLDIGLGPGRYYIGARFVGDGAGRAFAALQQPVHGRTEAFYRSEYFGYPDWVPVSELGLGPFDAVFKVYGDIIPAPGTLAVGLPCLLAVRRRR